MSLTYDFYYPGGQGMEGRTMYTRQGENVSTGVFKNFHEHIQKNAEEYMNMDLGTHKVVRSSYDNDYYTIVRKDRYTFNIENHKDA